MAPSTSAPAIPPEGGLISSTLSPPSCPTALSSLTAEAERLLISKTPFSAVVTSLREIVGRIALMTDDCPEETVIGPFLNAVRVARAGDDQQQEIFIGFLEDARATFRQNGHAALHLAVTARLSSYFLARRSHAAGNFDRGVKELTECRDWRMVVGASSNTVAGHIQFHMVSSIGDVLSESRRRSTTIARLLALECVALFEASSGWKTLYLAAANELLDRCCTIVETALEEDSPCAANVTLLREKFLQITKTAYHFARDAKANAGIVLGFQRSALRACRRLELDPETELGIVSPPPRRTPLPAASKNPAIYSTAQLEEFRLAQQWRPLANAICVISAKSHDEPLRQKAMELVGLTIDGLLDTNDIRSLEAVIDSSSRFTAEVGKNGALRVLHAALYLRELDSRDLNSAKRQKERPLGPWDRVKKSLPINAERLEFLEQVLRIFSRYPTELAGSRTFYSVLATIIQTSNQIHRDTPLDHLERTYEMALLGRERCYGEFSAGFKAQLGSAVAELIELAPQAKGLAARQKLALDLFADAEAEFEDQGLADEATGVARNRRKLMAQSQRPARVPTENHGEQAVLQFVGWILNDPDNVDDHCVGLAGALEEYQAALGVTARNDLWGRVKAALEMRAIGKEALAKLESGDYPWTASL